MGLRLGDKALLLKRKLQVQLLLMPMIEVLLLRSSLLFLEGACARRIFMMEIAFRCWRSD